MWQWYNCCASRVPEGKSILRINMDETSVCLFQGGGKGTVVFKKRRDPPPDEPVERASRAKRRCCLTHVAFICDRPDIQPVLPQVLIANETTLPAGQLAALQAAAPANVYLIRQKSAWNDAKLMLRIITYLALALRPHFSSVQAVLLMDACRVHIPPAVLYRSLAWHIWPIIVPAKLTWLMQPLDTHSFLRYKAFLKKAYQTARAQSASLELPLSDFLACMYSTIRHILQGQRWEEAFDADGFGHNQGRVSQYMRRQLQIIGPVSLPAVIPTEEQMQLCFPRGARVPHIALRRPLQPAAALPAGPVGFSLGVRPPRATGGPPSAVMGVPAAAAAAGTVDPPVPTAAIGRGPRTRSEHRLAAALAKGRPLPR